MLIITDRPPSYEAQLLTEENRSEVRLWLLEKYNNKLVSVDAHATGLFFYQQLLNGTMSERFDIPVGNYVVWTGHTYRLQTPVEFEKNYIQLSVVA